ncbi:MAG: hypothetical protein EXR77_16725 [Myxococcales bacterium]|nr:hypothetical protein [Myxococcales bacterium]
MNSKDLNPVRRRLALVAIGLTLAAGSSGCGEESGAASGGGTSGWSDAFEVGSGDTGATAESSTSGGSGAAEPPKQLPAEKEPEPDFGAPEGSPNFVYIPAPESDQLVRVAGASLQVSLIEVGAQPSVVQVVPDQDAALVLHRGSDEVAVVRSSSGADSVKMLAVTPHCNALAIDSAGKHAIVWYDHKRAKTGDPVGSFQSISLLRLAVDKEESLGISIGFRPSAVHFTGDGTTALVVTDDGVNSINLATAKQGDIAAPVAVTTKPLVKVEREVHVTDDGMWAVVREKGLAALTVVHLPSKKIVQVPLPAEPTDLDLIPGGKLALAVVRDAGLAALVTLPSAPTEAFAVQQTSMGDLTAGLARVTDDGKSALLYTSVAGIEQVATLDLATGVVVPVSIKKTVDTVFVMPNARKAILVHRPDKGPNYADPTEKFVDDSFGYTLFDLDTGYTKLVLTPVKPTEIAFAADPLKAWLLLPDPKNISHVVQEVAMATFLTANHALGSAPQHARFLTKAAVLAVTQAHPSGRITFLDAKTGTAKTVTGYELNGKVK